VEDRGGEGERREWINLPHGRLKTLAALHKPDVALCPQVVHYYFRQSLLLDSNVALT